MLKKILFLLSYSSIVAVSSFLPTNKQPTSILPKPEFMDLYNAFISYSDDPEKSGIAQALTQTLATNETLNSTDGALILAINSDLYIYDKNGKKLLQQAIRAENDTGFFELTGISHIGPAITYLLAIKLNNGDWKPKMQALQSAIQAAQKTNEDTNDPWLKQVNATAWQPYLNKIQNMNTYALNMSNNFIESILSGQREFTADTVYNEFLAGNKQYPIPYNNVMIGTFMLTTFTEMYDVYSKIKPLNIDWANTKVILRFVAGTNYTSGLSTENNWIEYYLNMASNRTLPQENIYIIPYAEVKDSLSQNSLNSEDLDYYVNQLWTTTKQRTSVAKNTLSEIKNIYIPKRAAIPGDYEYSNKNAIDDFIMRLKFSLSNPTEMLSNSTAFWMAGELENKNWDYKKVDIPGLTTGFPSGITEYPTSKT